MNGLGVHVGGIVSELLAQRIELLSVLRLFRLQHLCHAFFLLHKTNTHD